MHLRFLGIAPALLLCLWLASCDDGADVATDMPDTTAAGVDTSAMEQPQIYAPSDAGFSITFPAGMGEITEQDTTNQQQSVEIRTATAETLDSRAMVAWSFYPDSIFRADMVDALLDRAKSIAVEQMSASIEREDTISVAGHSGRSIYFTGTDSTGRTAHGRIDMVLARPNFYQIIFVTDSSAKLDDERVRSFFASLELPPATGGDSAAEDTTSSR